MAANIRSEGKTRRIGNTPPNFSGNASAHGVKEHLSRSAFECLPRRATRIYQKGCRRRLRRRDIVEGKRIPELDGIRGLAALAVVVAHYFGEVPHGLSALTVAWLGVDVFFVLSGFLIGSIILAQRDAPDFFRIFYLKRCARIVPVYAAVCILTLFAAAATAGHAWSDLPF
jgi:hypothetical protein